MGFAVRKPVRVTWLANAEESDHRLRAGGFGVVPEIYAPDIAAVTGQIDLAALTTSRDGFSELDFEVCAVSKVNDDLMKVDGPIFDREFDCPELTALSSDRNVVVILPIGYCSLTEKGPGLRRHCGCVDAQYEKNCEGKTDIATSHCESPFFES